MGRNPKQPVCDRDCFNCPYPDCICNTLTSKDIAESRALDRTILNPGKKPMSEDAYERHKERSRRYYHAHKEQRAAYLKEYKRTHREQLKESDRRWRKANPGKVREINRRQYLKRMERETPEQRAARLAYQKAYREARKARGDTKSASS